MVLALSVLGFVFFRKSSEKTRTAIFVLMFVGVASFGYATFRSASQVLPAAPEILPVASEGGAQRDSNVQRSSSTLAFSTDRDHPTKLRSNEIRGTGVDRHNVSYYFTFLAGPGEVKLTLDLTARGGPQLAGAILYDEDWHQIDQVPTVVTSDSQRVVKRIQISQQQEVIVKVYLDSSGEAAGDFLLRVEGAVRFL